MVMRWKRWRKYRRRVWESKADVTDGGERCLSLYNIYIYSLYRAPTPPSAFSAVTERVFEQVENEHNEDENSNMADHRFGTDQMKIQLSPARAAPWVDV